MENKSIVVDYINELVHGGPGSGRWPKGSTGNTPGSRTFFKKYEKKPKVVFTSADSYASKKHTTTYNSNSKTSNKQSNSTSNSTSAPNKQDNKPNNNQQNNSKKTSLTNLKKLDDMTDQELKDINNRVENEQKFKKAFPDKTKVVKDLVDDAGTVVNETKKVVERIPTKKQSMDLSKMSDQQMRDQINRAFLEKQYNDMFAQPSKAEKAKNVVSNILNIAGPVLTIGGTALSIALSIQELRKNKK